MLVINKYRMVERYNCNINLLPAGLTNLFSNKLLLCASLSTTATATATATRKCGGRPRRSAGLASSPYHMSPSTTSATFRRHGIPVFSQPSGPSLPLPPSFVFPSTSTGPPSSVPPFHFYHPCSLCSPLCSSKPSPFDSSLPSSVSIGTG